MNKKSILLTLLVSVLTPAAHAAHIDELGMDISLYSSDGAGNFVLQYDEFFGADGWMWGNNGSEPGLWGYANGGYVTNYIGGVNNLMTLAGASLTLTSGSEISFQNLVNSTASVSYATPSNTQFVNNTTDAARYSGLFGYSIANYDNTLSYSISVSADDCCFVSGAGGPSFNQSITFDPTQVVTAPPSAVPVPAAIWLFGSGLLGLIGFSNRKAST